MVDRQAEALDAVSLKTAVASSNRLDLDVVVHQSIDSTSSWCLQQIGQQRKMPFACFAEQQTQGRGRRGKHWVMSANTNVAMSLAWVFPVKHQDLQLLPLSIALAIVKTLGGSGLQHVQIKWPNDVYVNAKKIAGILLETRSLPRPGVASNTLTGAPAGSESHLAVVIGIGLNYDMEPEALSRIEAGSRHFPGVTDVCTEAKAQSLASSPGRAQLANALLQNVVAVCQCYPESASSYLDEFRQHYDYCKGKDIEIIMDNNERLAAVARGVTDSAELIALVDGKQQLFNSAEVSVKTSHK